MVALLGVVLVGVRVTPVFTADNDAGAAALVGVGSLLILLAAFGERLESLRYGDVELVLRRKATEAADRGDLEASKVLEEAADTLAHSRAETSTAYSSVRAMMPAGWTRTMEMERLVQGAKAHAKTVEPDGAALLRDLFIGDAGTRVWALELLQEWPHFASPRAVLDPLSGRTICSTATTLSCWPNVSPHLRRRTIGPESGSSASYKPS
jgi:hypothetical protein